MVRIAYVVFLAIFLSLAGKSSARAATLINEDFSDISDWTDLSTAITWGNNIGAISAFTTEGDAVHLTFEAFNYTGFTATNSLKTFTALDQQFLSPIDHASNILTLDFRARWNSLDHSGSGESGRFIIALNYDYPEGGLNTNLDDKFDDFDANWWARPAYHARIRSASTDNAQGTTLLQYGGGFTSAGEYEHFDDPSTPQSPDWWLPGFISGAGGVSPGTDADYPNNSWVSTTRGLATTELRNYRYIIKPDAQEFWFDENDDGIFTDDELEAMMPLPMTNEQDAPLYQYFPTFEGIRLYWRGAGGENRGQVFLDHLTVTVDPLNPLSDSELPPVEQPIDLSPINSELPPVEQPIDLSPINSELPPVEQPIDLSPINSELPPVEQPVDDIIIISEAPPAPETATPSQIRSFNSQPIAKFVEEESTSIPEPSQAFALLSVAVLGLLSRIKRQRI